MSDDGDKTEEASDHKIRKSMEEGNIPRSEDLNGFVPLILQLVALYIVGTVFLGTLQDKISLCFDGVFENLGLLGSFFPPACVEMWAYILPITLAFFGASILGAFAAYFFMYHGFVIPKEPIKLKLEALDVVANLQNMFSKQSMVDLLLSIGKETLFYGSYTLILMYFFKPMVYEMFCYENCKGDTLFIFIVALVIALTVICLIFTAIDVPLKIMFWKDKLKMSHKDQKDEHKELEGNPEIKHERDNFRNELLNGSPSGPANATFFIYSGNLIYGVRYNREESPAPIVVAVGIKPEAVQRIAGIARSKRRLMIQDDEFAKKLKAKATMGRPVPIELISHVRQAIMQLKQHEAQNGPSHPPKQKRG